MCCHMLENILKLSNLKSNITLFFLLGLSAPWPRFGAHNTPEIPLSSLNKLACRHLEIIPSPHSGTTATPLMTAFNIRYVTSTVKWQQRNRIMYRTLSTGNATMIVFTICDRDWLDRGRNSGPVWPSVQRAFPSRGRDRRANRESRRRLWSTTDGERWRLTFCPPSPCSTPPLPPAQKKHSRRLRGRP